jgi:hypothetical protein
MENMLAKNIIKHIVPTMWIVKDRKAYAIVRKKVKKPLLLNGWLFSNGIFGIEVMTSNERFVAIACPQYGEIFADADVEEAYVVSGTTKLKLHRDTVELLKWWSWQMKNHNIKKVAVEKSREYCKP